MTDYGFIGLGSMGSPMAAHLAELGRSEGNSLTVWNRSPGRDGHLAALGVTTAGSPRELVAACDVVVLMLPDLPQIEELTDGDEQFLGDVASATVLVICSSVSPQGVRRYADHVEELTGGLVRVVDAPVSGGAEGAAAGSLAIMAGGTDDAVGSVWAALMSMGSTVRHVGPIGAGSLVKACNQMVVAATLIALSEATALAESAGVSVPSLLDILAGGFGASRVLEVKSSHLISQTYAPTGAAKYMVKDLAFVRAEAESTGSVLPQADLSSSLFDDVVDAGLGDLDVSVVHAIVRGHARPAAKTPMTSSTDVESATRRTSGAHR